MAFLTKIPHQRSLSTVSLLDYKGINYIQPTNPSIIGFGNPRNRWSITTTSLHWKQSLNAYDSICKEMSTIIGYQEDDHGKHTKLVKRIRRLIAEANDESFEDLIMVDALQRLAIDYHFEDEIDLILRRRYVQVNNTNLFEQQNLYHVSLCFRILRQNGFHVSADAFMKFKGSDDKFEGKLNNDIRGLMALYEASHLRVEGEMILDEAETFSCQLLEDAMKFLDDEQVKLMVIHTLENPYQKTLPLFNFNNSIKEFKGTILQEVAEMEFNMMQSIHHMEIDQISRWWRDLGLCQELILARDQPLKWYLWPLAALTNPNLSMHRIHLTKTISLIYIIDDIFDVYGNIHELTLFTEAINRWDLNAIEELPYYMRSSFKAVYDITNEIASKVYDEHGFNPITSLQKSWATLCNAFLVEAKWFACGHIPMAKEYLKNGMVTSGVQVLLVHMFYLLGNGTAEINHDHGIVSSVSKILRLWDDLGSAQDENQDGHDGSYIKCFLNEHEGCSIKIAREHVIKLISDTWKSLNRECLSPNPYSPTFIKACNNIARMVPLMYSYGDNGSLPLLNYYIKAML
ncbi:hypothetical protein L6452_26192 [Arctium lappa]|uniref:Uncharacterized protein n=1 Tax=Arctium lappa TaxID=4217 RepID=A0ACB9ACV4_ARCLA|nr:hypothetical protein L6452_26192 [Arctium lappa]